MKPNSYRQKRHMTPRRRGRASGFALVISLSLMVLLTILSVGLLTLSTVSLRASTQEDAMRVARSNARMALMMAIGQLQKSAGPDQRITAPAAIADESTPIGFTGAWKAWARGEQGTSTYDKDSRFTGWLASSSLGGAAKPNMTTVPHVSPETPGAALLLGEGTLKERTKSSGADARMAVKPTIVEGAALNGHIAWATMDESTKSRLSLPSERTLSSPAREIAHVGAPAADGPQVIEALEDFEATAANVAKMISTGSADLQVGKDKMGQLTPDLTVWSASLMTNPVDGGLKKDLSSLFSRTLTAGEKNIRLFSDAGLQTGEGDPYMSALAGYHNLYDKIGKSIGGTKPDADGVAAFMPAGYDATVYNPQLQKYLPKPQAPKDMILAPSVLRVDVIFSLIVRDAHNPDRITRLKALGRNYMLHLMYLPVVTLHNPYNVPLTFDSVKVSFEDIPIGFNIMIDGQPLSSTLVPVNGMFASTEGDSSLTKNFGVTLRTSVTNTTQPIRMLPGQTKLFGTPKVEPSWRWVDEQPGAGADGTKLFDWNQGRNFTADFQMAPTLISPPSTSCGFDVDWLNPRPLQTAAGVANSGGEGIVALKGTEKIGVTFGPMAPKVAANTFTIVTEVKSANKLTKTGAIRVNYQSVQRLKELVEEGTSIRFPNGSRKFPEVFPKLPDDKELTVADLYERNETAVSKYLNPKPFVLFSVSGKTTKESFVPSRPYADAAPGIGISKIDFSAGKDLQGDVPIEMVMMPIRGGNRAIEEDRAKQEAFFFGGHGLDSGMPRATFYEIPQMPLQSLAQFRHARTGNTGFHPNVTYTAGESLASPLIGTERIKSSWPGDGSEMLDQAWLTNAAMWDRYFLSTIAPQNAAVFGTNTRTTGKVIEEFVSGKGRLLNERLKPLLGGNSAEETTAALSSNDAWLLAAAHMIEEGGFNVNSLSVDAWASVPLSASQCPGFDSGRHRKR
ncbi:hypothetical protein [Luteolibacter sp. Populi]|uniref:pilus assembly PilX family protein n=1 Tax=Luteolibacter sp. Populi TaxID=3230487 RepID=UPI00346741C5